ncbi:hypothetical protein GCM10007205_06230 [Oxalicibacterium flavum]|uniref:Uncharacterized protein n=1 Tax=Oxalicibacterium flavum TaxID=179467 RepID=A0A8J2UJU8_9BURK|nr:hypothetical protein [Oxalicibacterium flavum]GGB99661.1 hypothetical protein GCM10007205_06230 [Oxalicibacterium flavum]
MRKTACVLLALCMVACNNSDDIRTGEAAQRHALLSEPAFAFDAQEFADAFNAAARRHGSAFRIDHIDVRHGAVHDYFQQVFGAGMSLTAGISKESGRITSVTALVNGSDADADRKKLLILAEIVMSATNPRLPREQSVATATAMLQEVSASSDAHPFPQRFVDHVRYGLRNDSGVGYWLIANPA